MSPRSRLAVFWVAASGFILLLLWGLAGLPAFGHYPGPYGDLLNALTVPERHVTNVVTAIVFDYRGLDTLGEEFIFFASVAGVALLLRGSRGESETAPPEEAPDRLHAPRSDVVHLFGLGLIGLTALFALYIILHAHLTPGGGFQGGAILGTAFVLVYLVNDYQLYRRLTPQPLFDFAEALGAGSYVLIGLATMLAGGAFLENLLPLGQVKQLLSGGTIPLINLAVGLEVAAGFTLICSEFLQETRQPQPGEEIEE
jgi:multicomponent Na+:H+ antiporter subunit B